MQEVSRNIGNAKTLYYKLASSNIGNDGTGTGIGLGQGTTYRKRVVIGVVLGSVTLSMVLLGLVSIVIQTRKRKLAKQIVTDSLIMYDYKDLQTATGRFSENLGHGGFVLFSKGLCETRVSLRSRSSQVSAKERSNFEQKSALLGPVSMSIMNDLVDFAL